jgi:DNA-binding MarR family transcriptional regulator
LNPDKPPETAEHQRGDDALKSLGEQLNDPCLKSSTRILILISLAINRRLGFIDLLHLTGMGKGSLSNHLEKLEAAGYIKTRRIMIFGGHRVMVEATEKGLQVYESYMRTMKMLSDARGDTGSEARV